MAKERTDSPRKTLRDYLLSEGVKGKRFWDNNNSLRIFEVQDVCIHRSLSSLMVRYGHPSWFDNSEDEKGITSEVILFNSYLNAPEYFK